MLATRCFACERLDIFMARKGKAIIGSPRRDPSDKMDEIRHTNTMACSNCEFVKKPKLCIFWGTELSFDAMDYLKFNTTVIKSLKINYKVLAIWNIIIIWSPVVISEWWRGDIDRHHASHHGVPDVLPCLKFAQTSSVVTDIRSFTLPKLSSAGRTSRENTGDPSGSGGAE